MSKASFAAAVAFVCALGTSTAAAKPGDIIVGALAGGDSINARRGSDRACGGPGNDRIKATKGRNRVDCGPGKRDVAIVNRRTKVRGCERVVRR